MTTRSIVTTCGMLALALAPGACGGASQPANDQTTVTVSPPSSSTPPPPPSTPPAAK